MKRVHNFDWHTHKVVLISPMAVQLNHLFPVFLSSFISKLGTPEVAMTLNFAVTLDSENYFVPQVQDNCKRTEPKLTVKSLDEYSNKAIVVVLHVLNDLCFRTLAVTLGSELLQLAQTWDCQQ